jgi:2-methylcitrate dehydratase PrpD
MTLTQDPVTSTGAPVTNATETLARFGATLRYEELPAEVAHQAKRIIVDTLACVVGAQHTEGAQITSRVIAAMSGAPEATIIPTGQRTSAPNAAFVNAELSNMLDLDDNLLNHTHFANTSVTAPLAMAERQHATGKDLIAAVVAAYEVSSRLTLALTAVADITGEWPDVEVRWHKTYGMGFSVFGATSGCGNLVGLSPEQMRNAFGVAGYAAPVPSVAKCTSNDYLPMKKYASYGSIAWNSAVAALMAKEGLTADVDILDGDYGFWRMAGSEECDWAMLTGRLREKWWSLETSFKFHPICTWNRQPISALELVMAEHSFKPEDVETITVLVHPCATQRSLWLLTTPRDYLETQLSHPWAMAMTVLGVPGPEWQLPKTINDPRARDLAARVRVGVDPNAEREYYEQVREGAEVRRVRRSPSTAIVRLKDGREFSASADLAKGDPFSPQTRLTDDELRGKLVDYGSLVVPRARLEKAADLLFDLDRLTDIGEATKLLCVEA